MRASLPGIADSPRPQSPSLSGPPVRAPAGGTGRCRRCSKEWRAPRGGLAGRVDEGLVAGPDVVEDAGDPDPGRARRRHQPQLPELRRVHRPLGRRAVGQGEGETAGRPAGGSEREAVRPGRVPRQPGLHHGPLPHGDAVQHALDRHAGRADDDGSGLGVRGADPAAQGEPAVGGRVGHPGADARGSGVRAAVDEGPQIPQPRLHGPGGLGSRFLDIGVPAPLGQSGGGREHRPQPPGTGPVERDPHRASGPVARRALAPQEQHGRVGGGSGRDGQVEGERPGRIGGAVGPYGGYGGGHAALPFRSTSAAL